MRNIVQGADIRPLQVYHSYHAISCINRWLSRIA